MTPKQKGKMLEKKTHDYLEKNGWLVHTAISPPTVFREVNGKKMWINAGKNYDIFNLWDHVAVRANNSVHIKETAAIFGFEPSEFDQYIWESCAGYFQRIRREGLRTGNL